ncbi:MAG TPA: YncE family protein, partial [Geminicoccaceae bacterium]|nr:YncE family protein [Geminicoccaceae bacterium]
MALALTLAAATGIVDARSAAAAPATSSPIALAANGRLVWVVNPDDDSVSVIRTDTNVVVATIELDDDPDERREPQSIALDPLNRFAFVANAAADSVSVIRILNANPDDFQAALDDRVGANGELTTGAEPWSVVASPDGRRVFVANSGQDTITVLTPRAPNGPRVLGRINLRNGLCNNPDQRRHFQPRGLAVTADSRQLYVARFFSFTRFRGRQGDDRGKLGVVCRLDIDTTSVRIAADYRPAQRLELRPRATGFQFPGLAGDTFAYPNQLQGIVIRGDRAYLPNIAASPSGPLRFNVDTHAFVNRIDGVNGATQTDAGALNLHLGARDPEPGKRRVFFANPWAIAFTSQSGAGAAYVVSAASDVLVKLDVAANGALSFTGDADTTRYIDLNDPRDLDTAGTNAGKNPRGIAINNAGTRAYVANFVSRNVSVVDLTTDQVIAVVRTTDLPAPGSEDERVQVGAEMFFSSRGVFDRPAGATVSTRDRLSSEGWQACSSCHFEGLTDSVVWVFATGPRKSVPLNGSFNPQNPDEQRVLNYSAIFDEIEDFEINIRNVSGPGNLANGALDPNHGLLIGDNGNINQAPGVVNAFAVPNAGRPQHTVTLPNSTTAVPALTALREWVQFAVRTPNGPLTNAEVPGGVPQAQIDQGRALFDQQGCDNCHSGDQWTTSIKDFTSPPAANEIFTETNPAPLGGTNPVGAQYLDRFLEDIGSFNLGVPGQGNPIATDVGADERANPTLDANGQLVFPDALGIDYNGDGRGEGFNVPSLLGVHASPPYYHNGACETLACVVSDVNHRTANGTLPDVLDTPQ